MRRLNVAVVGAGISGVSAARHLAERGHHVTLFEQFPLGHDRGSSHGKSRIIRRAYSDAFYTSCMRDAYPMWRELEKASGQKIAHEVGLLYFGHQDREAMEATEEGLKEFKVPYEKYSRQSVEKAFEGITLESDEVGLFTPEAGWVDAEKALSATLDLATKAGAQLVIKHVTREEIETFDKAVVTAGPWIKDWWPSAPVSTTLQTFGYVQANVTGPVWIEESEDWLYGFPSDEWGVKIGVHRPGIEIDPRSDNRTPADEDLGKIADFAKRRFGIANPEVHYQKGCIYTTTESEDFLLNQVNEKIVVASACSGHGFKFGPWFGKLLANIAEGRDDVACYGRFLA